MYLYVIDVAAGDKIKEWVAERPVPQYHAGVADEWNENSPQGAGKDGPRGAIRRWLRTALNICCSGAGFRSVRIFRMPLSDRFLAQDQNNDPAAALGRPAR